MQWKPNQVSATTQQNNTIVLEFAKPIRMKQEEQCIKIRLKKIWKTANKKDNHDVLRLNNKMTNIRKQFFYSIEEKSLNIIRKVGSFHYLKAFFTFF